jgi:hypothetical protein
MLDGMERVSPLILTTKTGQSLKKRYFTRLWREAMEKAGLQSVLLPNATKATVRDHRGHMDWPACWDEVLRFSIRQHWMQCVITS